MKNQKLLSFLAAGLASALILSQAVLAAPPGPPPSANSPDATFNSIHITDGATSGNGVIMDAADRPLITRGWDAFTSGALTGVGRWGLFMQPNYITIGFPNISGKGFKVTQFNADSSVNQDYLAINSTGINLNSVLNANGNSTGARLEVLTSFCTNITSFAFPGNPAGTFTMVASPNPCTIQFLAPDPATCSGLAGTYNAGNKQCTWTEPGYVPNSSFCMLAGSPNPYISGGNCIWTSSVANINGGININGPIANNSPSSPVFVQDADGLLVGKSATRAVYAKASKTMGEAAEIGFVDSVDNDGLNIVSPRGLGFKLNTDDYPNMALSIYDTSYKAGVRTLQFVNNASDGIQAPLKFTAIDSDAIYNSGMGGSGTLNEDGQSVGITANGDRVGIMATSWHGGIVPQTGTYSNGGGKSFKSLGIYALGNTTANNSGAGLFETLGGAINTELAWKDNSGVQWAIYANGNVGVNGTASKTGGGSWSVLSDLRLKDIKENFTRGLDNLMQINPVAYNYKKDNPKGLISDDTYIGVIAQEVQKAIPEAVSLDDSGYYMVNNDPIIWTMVNSIQELKLQNDVLTKENSDLEQRLSALEDRIQ